MNRIVIASDSHGRNDLLKKIIEEEEKQYKDKIIYLCAGDSQSNSQEISPFISVKGNMDFFSNLPPYIIIPIDNHKIFITHGHLYSWISIQMMMEENKCDICITGHTHVPKIEIENNTYFINPGSIARPRHNSKRQYMVMDIENDGRIKISNKFIEEII